MRNEEFWLKLDQLVAGSLVKVDRPKGTAHPRYPSFVYALDYGYLENTRSGDGGGIDVWVGGLSEKGVTAIICTIDLEKRDSEMKILLGCTAQEVQTILTALNKGSQGALLVERPSWTR